jgi:glyoxylase-like metal-dependent hydrolase (beta-lactamase superfamily II)
VSNTAIQIGGYEIDIVVQGFPGKSVCHGGLGWSTIALVHGQGRLGIVDGGTFGMRIMLQERLKKRGLGPKSVTDMFLTHSHYDHSVNWTMFNHARIVIGAHELEWSLKEPWGETPVAELYMKELNTWPTLHRAQDGEEVFPGMTAYVAGGHTPGHLIFVLRGADRDVIFTGDAAKNRAEMVAGKADMTYDAKVTAASLEMIWKFWRARPNNVLVPGHDVPMVLKDGKPEYIATREAAVKSWFGRDLETTQLFNLTMT